MKKTLLMLLCMTITMMPLFAGEVDPSSTTANTTADILEDDVDYFMDVNDFGNIENKLFFLGLDQTTARLGYGQFMNDLYFAGYYQGFIFEQDGDEETEAVETPIFDSTLSLIGESVVETTTLNNDEKEDLNLFAFNFGMGNLGVQLAYNQHKDITNSGNRLNSDITKEVSTVYDAAGSVVSQSLETYNEEDKYSSMNPSLTVGGTFAVQDLTIKPTFTADFAIIKRSNTTKEVNYDTLTGSGYTVEGITNITDYDSSDDSYLADRIVMDFSINSDVEYGKFTFGVGYGLELPLYSNDYKGAAGSSETVKGIVNQSDTSVDYNYGTNDLTKTDSYDYRVTEYTSNMTHGIGLSAKYVDAVTDRFTYGAEFLAGLSFTNIDSTISSGSSAVRTYSDYSDATNDSVTTTVITDQGKKVENDVFIVSPQLNLGMQYALVPEKLDLNMGVNYVLPSFSKDSTVTKATGYETTTTTIVNADGTTSTFNSSDIDDPSTNSDSEELSWSKLSYNVSAGMIFHFNEDMHLDLTMNTTSPTIYATRFTTQFVISK